MGNHMKTTVEISDALFEAAKERANERGVTFRALIEEGLRAVLEGSSGSQGFTLRDGSVAGRGLQPDIREGDWEQVAALIYEGRGA